MHAIKITQESLVTSKMSYWARRENKAVGLVFRQLLLISYFFFKLPTNPRAAAHSWNCTRSLNNTHTKRAQQKFGASWDTSHHRKVAGLYSQPGKWKFNHTSRTKPMCLFIFDELYSAVKWQNKISSYINEEIWLFLFE